MTKAIVLLSGGQDSTTSLFWALQNFDDVQAVSIHYGQRHKTELEAARLIAAFAGVPHSILELPVLARLADSALVRPSDPLAGAGGRPDVHAAQGLPTSFVPGRNLLFLGIAGALAVREGAHDIVTGVCQTDFSGYPDCRRSFIDAMEKALEHAMPSSAWPLRILTPLMHLTKAETVRFAMRLPRCMEALALSVTCYEGRQPGCGACPACDLRAKGFREAGVPDPAG